MSAGVYSVSVDATDYEGVISITGITDVDITSALMANPTTYQTWNVRHTFNTAIILSTEDNLGDIVPVIATNVPYNMTPIILLFNEADGVISKNGTPNFRNDITIAPAIGWRTSNNADIDDNMLVLAKYGNVGMAYGASYVIIFPANAAIDEWGNINPTTIEVPFTVEGAANAAVTFVSNRPSRPSRKCLYNNFTLYWAQCQI